MKKKLVIEKLELLKSDLKTAIKARSEGKDWLTLEMIGVRIREIEKLIKSEEEQ